MSLTPERTAIIEETLHNEEEKLGIKNGELFTVLQAEAANSTNDARDLTGTIDDQIKKSLKDVNLKEFLKEEEKEDAS